MNKVLISILLLTTSIAMAQGKRETGDYNFDGNEDYRIYVMSNGKSIIWEYYIYNPDKKVHETNSSLVDLRNPTFDAKMKTISTFMPGGHSGMVYVKEQYKWQNNILIQTRVVRQDWLKKTNTYIRVTADIENGKIRISDIEEVKP